jgi:electron transfer flavoprotein alpha subunit
VTAIVVIAEVSGDDFDPITAELVSAALKGGAEEVHVVAWGLSESQAVGYEGVKSILLADDPPNSVEQVKELVHQVVTRTGATGVVASFNWRNTEFAAAIAATHGMSIVTDCLSLEFQPSGWRVSRPAYSGKVVVDLDVDGGLVALLRDRVWPAARRDAVPVVKMPTLTSVSAVTQVGSTEAPRSGVDLHSADIIFAVGRGLGAEGVPEFVELTDRLGVSLGASRPVVDAGWLPHAHQIGQSGTSVTPRLYVAFGISGAMQHLVGVRKAQRIVAVNTDPRAPIFSIADVAVVADGTEVVKALLELLPRS